MSKNAKFEEWHYESQRQGTAQEAWQAAIQSLEVTPELVRLALYEMGGESDYQPGYGGYVGPDSMTAALTAVFNAIKGQP